MNISEEYKKLLKNVARNKYLLAGRVPSREAIRIDSEALEREVYGAGIESLLLAADRKIKPRTDLKIEDFNTPIVESFQDLLLYRDLLIHKWKDLNDSFKLNEMSYFFLKKELEVLDRQLEDNILINIDSGGYFLVIEDRFLNGDHINTENSTTVYDYTRSLIRSSLGSGVLSVIREDSGISYNGRVGISSSVRIIGDADIKKIIKKENSETCVFMGTNSTPGTYTLSLNLDLLEEKTFSVFNLLRNIEGGEGFCWIETSLDGLNYTAFGSRQSLANSLSFNAENRTCRYVRINIVKSESNYYDPDLGYVYLFDLYRIEALKNVDTEESSVFYSQIYRPGAFSKVALETCEAINDNNQIDYYIITEEEEEIPIIPLNRESGISLIVNSSKKKVVNNLSAGASFFEKLSEGAALSKTDTLDLSLIGTVEGFGESFIENEHVVNSFFSTENVDQLNKIKVFKGITSEKSEDAIVGWKVGDLLSTWFYIDIESPVTIDFGPNNISINGRTVSGSYTFEKKGFYHLECSPTKYSFVRIVNSEEELRRVDLLYPYNIKYMIEGYPYPPGFVGERVYSGMKYRAESKMTRKDSRSLFLLDKENTYYIIRKSDSKNGIALYDDRDLNYLIEVEDLTDYPNEIYLKAVFKCRETSTTPVLFSYRLKLGR